MEHLQWLLLAVPPRCSKVSWGVCSFDFAPPRAFDFDKKLTQIITSRCANNYLLSCDKTISSLLELIGHVLSISEYVLEKH